MKSKQITDILTGLSPESYAFDWDNVGLLAGRNDREISKILVTLDIDDKAVETAVEIGANLIVAHHPMIFKGIKRINDESALGRRILTLCEHGINCFAMHTNFDIKGSMAELAGSKLNLLDCVPLEETTPGFGIGITGNLAYEVTAEQLCKIVKERFGITNVILYGDRKKTVKRVAVCPGSGKDEIGYAFEKNADILLTGDITYHYGIDAVADGLLIIDAGHYGLEHIFSDFIADYLRSELTEDIEVIAMKTDFPYSYL